MEAGFGLEINTKRWNRAAYIEISNHSRPFYNLIKIFSATVEKGFRLGSSATIVAENVGILQVHNINCLEVLSRGLLLLRWFTNYNF